jgi:hypothetical protein
MRLNKIGNPDPLAKKAFHTLHDSILSNELNKSIIYK